MRLTKTLLACAALAAATVGTATAEEKTTKPKDTGGIQWFATWVQAEAEANRTQRPILLTSAAPHCKKVSGKW